MGGRWIGKLWYFLDREEVRREALMDSMQRLVSLWNTGAGASGSVEGQEFC